MRRRAAGTISRLGAAAAAIALAWGPSGRGRVSRRAAWRAGLGSRHCHRRGPADGHGRRRGPDGRRADGQDGDCFGFHGRPDGSRPRHDAAAHSRRLQAASTAGHNGRSEAASIPAPDQRSVERVLVGAQPHISRATRGAAGWHISGGSREARGRSSQRRSPGCRQSAPRCHSNRPGYGDRPVGLLCRGMVGRHEGRGAPGQCRAGEVRLRPRPACSPLVI